MPEITVGDRLQTVHGVVKLRKGEELAAAETLRKNGSDDVIYRVGEDTFVVSGRGLTLKGLKPNDTIIVGCDEGRVLLVDREANSFKDGLMSKEGLIGGGVIAGFGIAAFIQGVLAGANMAGLGLIVAAGGVVVGVAVNALKGAYAAHRKVDFEAIKRHGA